MPGPSEKSLEKIFLTPEDVVRFEQSCLKLEQHLTEEIILTGSVAGSLHLLSAHRLTPIKLNDIDVVVKDLSVFRHSVKNDFLIRHFHPHREKGKILLMLIDPEHELKICCFTPQTENVMGRLTGVEAGSLFCHIISVEDLLVKLLGVIYPLSRDEPVEEKYFNHFRRLLPIVNLEKVQAVWLEYRRDGQIPEFEAAIKIVGEKVKDDPHLLRSFRYSQDLDEKCPWCVSSELFPLAPLQEIHQILGYV